MIQIRSLTNKLSFFLTCGLLCSICFAANGSELVTSLPGAHDWASAVSLVNPSRPQAAKGFLSIPDGQLWVHVDISSGKSDFLNFPNNVFDRYQIYSADTNDVLYDSGIRNPNVIDWNPSTKLSLTREWGLNFFLYLETASDSSVPFEFMTFQQHEIKEHPGFVNVGMYYGSIVLMSAFCLLLSFFNKDPDAWKLGLTILAWAVPSFAVWGYGDTILPYDLGEILGSAVNQLVVVASMASAWFTTHFLKNSAGHSKLYYGIKIILVLQALYLIGSLVFGISWIIALALVLFPNFGSAILAVIAFLNGDRAAPYLFVTSLCSASPFIFLFINPLSQQSTIALAMLTLTLTMLALMQRIGERFHALGHQARVASERERFLASMSHEIRTPLNGIIGFSELCSQENLEGDVKQYFHQIDRSSKMLLGIVNDVLDYSKLQAADVEVVSEAMSIEHTLKDVITINKPLADLNGITLSYEIAPDVGEYLLTDPYRCAQVLINLCGNAVKFSRDGDVQLRASRDKQDILFQVIDNGIGIEKDVLASLFNPFSQANAGTARKFGGTGLGLAISKQLCELLNGELSAVSKEGQGSEFTFRLPYRECEPPATPSIADVSNLAGKRVLLAEDNAVNLKLATRILEKNGLTVDAATDGKIALEKATKNDYDFILMDMQMPELTGTQTTIEIRELGINHPIIAMTANTSESDKEACMDAGMNDFLAKPIEQQQLLKKLELWSAPV